MAPVRRKGTIRIALGKTTNRTAGIPAVIDLFGINLVNQRDQDRDRR
jgi:hypothetical protein